MLVYKPGQTNISRNFVDLINYGFHQENGIFPLGTISEKTCVGAHFQCAKFHACIQKCTIHLKFRAKPSDYLKARHVQIDWKSNIFGLPN